MERQELSSSRAVRSDFGARVSENRAFLAGDVLRSDGADRLLSVREGGAPITTLRDADKLVLDRFTVNARMRSLMRAAILLNDEDSSALASDTLATLVDYIVSAEDWPDVVDFAFRVLRLGALAGAWPQIAPLLSWMQSRWGSTDDLQESSRALVYRESAIENRRAWIAVRNYLQDRSMETLCTSIRRRGELSLHSSWHDLRIPHRTHTKTIRYVQKQARRLAAADLRALDREDDQLDGQSSGVDTRVIRVPGVLDGLGDRLALIRDFSSSAGASGNAAWSIPAERLFLCTRPPSYFDVARQYGQESINGELQETHFRRVLETVNALRGTEYWNPVGEVVDQTKVVLPLPAEPGTRPASDPRIILGNLRVSEAAYRASLRNRGAGRVHESRERLEGIGLILEKASIAARGNPSQRSLLVLPELALPRAWLRPLANFVARENRFGLVTGLEYAHGPSGTVRNQAVAALPGPFSSVAAFWWTKQYPADEELRLLRREKLSFPPPQPTRGISVEGEYGRFSVLICSELIEAQRVADLVGRVELVVVPAWNRDTPSFSHLLQSVGLQAHAIIAVANNAQYSDCRIWAPLRESWRRDCCRLIERGTDSIVSSVIPLCSLRDFHDSRSTLGASDKTQWKPLPPSWTRH